MIVIELDSVAEEHSDDPNIYTEESEAPKGNKGRSRKKSNILHKKINLYSNLYSSKYNISYKKYMRDL